MFFNESYSQNYAYREGQIFHLGNGYYCAAVASEYFVPYVAEQEYDNWCWAACIKMVLNYQGVQVSQSQIVQKAYGRIVNSPANCDIMTNSADGWRVSAYTLEAWQESSVHQFELIDDLAKKYPVIIGLNMPGHDVGHAYVLTGIYFVYDNNMSKKPYRVILRDPWPDNPSKTELDWVDFCNRINCIVHVTPYKN